MGGGGIIILHYSGYNIYCTQTFPHQRERTQKNHKLLSKLYCRTSKGIEVNWHTYLKNDSCSTKHEQPNMLGKQELRLPFVPSLLLEPPTDQKSLPPRRATPIFTPRRDGTWKMAKRLPCSASKSRGMLRRNLFGSAKSSFQSSSGGFRLKMILGILQKNSLYFSMFKKGDPAFSTETCHVFYLVLGSFNSKLHSPHYQ